MGCPAPPMGPMSHPGTSSGPPRAPITALGTALGAPRSDLGTPLGRTRDLLENLPENIYISAGPLVGHTAVEGRFRYNIKYQVYKYRYQV